MEQKKLSESEVNKQIKERYPLAGSKISEIFGSTEDDYRASGFIDALKWLNLI